MKKSTDAQLAAIRDKIAVDGRWENAEELKVMWHFDHVGVSVIQDGQEAIFIGIEKDGYAHS